MHFNETHTHGGKQYSRSTCNRERPTKIRTQPRLRSAILGEGLSYRGQIVFHRLARVPVKVGGETTHRVLHLGLHACQSPGPGSSARYLEHGFGG